MYKISKNTRSRLVEPKIAAISAEDGSGVLEVIKWVIISVKIVSRIS